MNLIQLIRHQCISDWRYLIGYILMSAWIATSYLWIPAILWRILRQVGGKVLGGGEVRGFAIFVASCGVTHIFGIAILFFPSLDWIALLWLAWTAVLSWQTARLISGREQVIVRAILDARELETRVSNDLGTPRQEIIPDASTVEPG